MSKNKKVIISICVILVVVMAALFLPDFLWNNHLKAISGKAENVVYSLDMADKGLTSEEFAAYYITNGTDNIYESQTDVDEVLSLTKSAVVNMAEFGDDEVKSKLTEAAVLANLQYCNENLQLVNTDSETFIADVLYVSTQSYVGNYIYYIYIVFEKKTSVITNFSISIYTEDEDMSLQDTEWLAKLEECGIKYYANLGLDSGCFAIEYLPEENHLDMNLLTALDYMEMYGSEDDEEH